MKTTIRSIELIFFIEGYFFSQINLPYQLELCYRISIFNLFWIAVTVKEEGRNKEQGRKREGKKRVIEGRRNEWSERHIEVLTGTNTNRVASLLKILKKGGMFIFLTFATSLILTDILEIV